jgi:hypothetical protein
LRILGQWYNTIPIVSKSIIFTEVYDSGLFRIEIRTALRTFFHFPKLAKQLVSRGYGKLSVKRRNSMRGYTSIGCASRENPTKTGFKSNWRARGPLRRPCNSVSA